MNIDEDKTTGGDADMVNVAERAALAFKRGPAPAELTVPDETGAEAAAATPDFDAGKGAGGQAGSLEERHNAWVAALLARC